MAKKQMYTILILGMLLISLVVLAINQPVELKLPSITSLTNTAANSASINETERAEAANVARWEAAGKFYAEQAGSRPKSSDAADQARWEAAAKFYAQQANHRPENAIAADQARWEAMGKLYTDLGAGNTKTADQTR